MANWNVLNENQDKAGAMLVALSDDGKRIAPEYLPRIRSSCGDDAIRRRLWTRYRKLDRGYPWQHGGRHRIGSR
ncbi:MAG: hypothetical protein EA384_05780 [Spirochaetaceae bacterium]|nr:MAG: hypothetical protein EA384_05780 [Spirochaetaceae bacterium]